MRIGIGVLAAFSLLFSLIGERNTKRSWIIGTVVCSLAGGLLMAIVLTWNDCLDLLRCFGIMEYSHSLGKTVDFIAVLVLYALGSFSLSRMIAGFIRPLNRDGLPFNPILRLVLYAICGVLGAALIVLGIVSDFIQGLGVELGSIVFLCSGIIYLLSGLSGVFQWNLRRKRIQKTRAEGDKANVQL